MALQPIISSMLIDFEQSNATAQQKAYQKQVYSAIKLNMSDLQKYGTTDKFTQCYKCKAILTDKDNGHVFDFQQVDSNPADFKKQSVQQLRQNKFTKVLWMCGFCSHDNIVNTVDIKFAKNKTRLIERQKMAQKRDPIMLIVFDVSGSMEELIQDSSGKNPNWPHLQKIKQTKIYKKIVADEQKQLQQFLKTQSSGGSVPKDAKNKYIDYLKKNKLLMGLTEYLISKINPFKKSTTTAQQANKKINDFCNNSDSSRPKKAQGNNNKTIGFMFFNSNLILSLDNQKSKKILIVDSNEQYKSKIQGFQRQVVDFDSFQALYKMGQKHGGDYTTKISNFQFENLDIKSMSNYLQGQTALGPAIVTALGVISKHGQGSSIVVVTDGIGNKGIFDQTQPWDQGYKLLKMRLEKLKCFMTVLQFRKLVDKAKMKQQDTLTGLDRFCQRHSDSVVKKINVLLNQNDINKNSANSLQDIQKKMKAGIDRQNCVFSNQVLIKCQHPHVSYARMMDQLKGKLFNSKQTLHISPQFKEGSLAQKDFLHHFMTQIVIRYQNTQTGQQCVFMSYIVQKFIKYTKMRPKDLKSLDTQNTFMNIIQYLHNEEQKFNLDNLPLGIIRETFRKTLCMTPNAQKTLRFPSQHVMGEESYQWMQNMRRFEDQSLINEQKRKENMKNGKHSSIQTSKKSSTKGIFGAKLQTSIQSIIQEKKIQEKATVLEEDSQEQYVYL